MSNLSFSGVICAVGGLVLSGAPAAHAAYVVDFQQVGSNVVATGSGDFSDFSYLSFTSFDQPPDVGVDPSTGYLAVGNATLAGDVGDNYAGVSGPKSFGAGGFTAASSTSGTVAGISGAADTVILPSDYNPGDPMAPTITIWDNSTISSLGLRPGSYVYTWGAGANADSLTVNISGVPEASTWAMLLLGAGLIGATLRTARRKADAAFTLA
jgi:hypothetical protein